MSLGLLAGARAIAAALVAAARESRRSWRAASPAVRTTTVVLAVIIAAGVVLRLRDIAFPPRFTFDEQHFVPNARRYLLGEPDDNDHPPLGKLFIAVGLLLFGDNPTGWRAASLIFGLQSLVVAAALARELFADRRAGWFAAAFLAGDGFFLAYSRTALLDGGLTCLVLWSLLAAVAARTWRGVLACAILVGLAASVKWSGGMAVVPAVVAILVLGRAPRWSVLLFAAAPLVHLALWLATLPLSGRPADPRALLTLMRALLRHHIEVGRMPNPLASPWYTWPFLYHPIVVKLADQGTRRRYASSVGNPLLFLSSTMVILTALWAGITVALRGRVGFLARLLARPLARLSIPPDVARAAILLAVGWLALLAPWIVGRGSGTFMYHYLPSYGFALVSTAGLAAHLERRFPRGLLAYVGLVLSIGIFFAPVWAELPLAEAVANRRLILAPWQP
jgi:dolichyl-phosphate-mannose--protein O-mannosyl transferase